MLQKHKQPRRTDTEWINLIQECRTSGISDKEWCEQHSIPISTFYTKISRLRKKACDIPAVQNHVVYQPQQVVPLKILDDSPLVCQGQTDEGVTERVSAVVLNIHGYRIEISNYAAKETILNTLSVLQQLC
jgi:hypothetical protein